MTAFNVVYLLSAALNVGVCIARLRRFRRERVLVLAVVGLQFGSVAIAFAAAAPVVYVGLDTAAGIPNLATLVVYCAILLCSASLRTVLLLWSLGPVAALAPMRRWLVAYGVTVAALVVLFFMGRVDDGEHPIDFDAHYATRPDITQFLLIYYVGFLAIMASTAWAAWCYARMGARRPLVIGMRVTAFGAVFALGYCGMKISSLIGADAGRPLSGLATTWAPLSATTGAFLMVVGLTMPSWGSRLSVIPEWIRLYRAYTALYPLWRQMDDLFPGIALQGAANPHPSWRARWAVCDLRLRVYRRIIEIHDGRLALRDYCDARVSAAARRRGAAAGLTGLPLQAFQEATVLTAAIHARRIGKMPLDVACDPSERPAGGLGEDVAWYSSVAAVLGSTLITQTVDDVDPVLSS